jgi:integrase
MLQRGLIAPPKGGGVQAFSVPAFRFLFHTVLKRPHDFQVPLAKFEQRLPEILSRQELARLFACAGHGKPRVVLMTTYGLDLRVGELCRLRVADVDGHADRMCVRVVQGKSSVSSTTSFVGRAGQLCALGVWFGHAHGRRIPPHAEAVAALLDRGGAG